MKQLILTKNDLTLEEMVVKLKNENTDIKTGWNNDKYWVKVTVGKRHYELTESRIKYYKYVER